jgi:hypothetical protein
MTVRRVLAAFIVVVGLAGLLSSGAFSARSGGATGKQVTITVRLIQEATYQYPHGIPTMPGGLVLSTQLRLYAVGTVLGFPSNTFLGTMSFTYQLHGSCSAGASGCTGTTNLHTLTSFPGGTITANGAQVRLASGLVVPVQSGTGVFKGVTGTIDIAPNGQADSVYKLNIPAS